MRISDCACLSDHAGTRGGWTGGTGHFRQEDPNLNSHVVVKPRRRTRTTIIGMPVHTTDPRMRWSDVGPTASCHRVPVTVWIQGYRRVSSKEVCYE